MIRVQLPRLGEVGVSFRHEHGQWVLMRGDSKPAVVKVVTTCTVYEIMDGKPAGVLSKGTAKCSETDNFNKDTARKIALERAIESFNREERRKIWTAYFNR